MSIKETSCDWHPHGAVRSAVVDVPPEAMVARLIGSVCLAYMVQMHVRVWAPRTQALGALSASQRQASCTDLP
jgi:hypothetical protein